MAVWATKDDPGDMTGASRRITDHQPLTLKDRRDDFAARNTIGLLPPTRC